MQWFKVFGWAAVLWAGGASAETRLTNRTLDLPESAGDPSAEFESVTGSMRWSEYFARHPA